MEHSNINNCMRIWRGEHIEDVAHDEMEEIVLSELALCMLEQEINWGNRSWQKFTHFGNRGRDMIMGFINHAFDMGMIIYRIGIGMEQLLHLEVDLETMNTLNILNFKKIQIPY